MADWEALRTRLQEEFGLDVDQEDELAVTISRDSAEGQRRAQRVMLSRYRAFGTTMVEFRSAFGEIGDYDAESLLVESLRLPVGAVALHGRYLVVAQKDALEDLSEEAVVRMLTRVSLLADVLEGRSGSDRF